MSRPRLLLCPSFTEVEWGLRPLVEEWAEVASFDMPGVDAEPLPGEIRFDRDRPSESLADWRRAGAERGLAEVERRGWERFVLVTDGYGAPTAVRIARLSPGAVLGIALGHASLSHSHEGERAPANRAIWDALVQLARQGKEEFVRYGIAQMTLGGFDEEVAGQMLERFPEMDVMAEMLEALGAEAEPIGDDLEAVAVPLLLAKHEGCLSRTDEGFEDIAAAVPSAAVVICPEACAASPAFAAAIREFAMSVGL